MELNDERWAAIVNNDVAYDGKFCYAVQTTGIFCRPSCRSRTPARGNVRIFPDAQSAMRERYRPCKRCRPDGRRQPSEEWTAHIAELIEQRYAEPLTLAMLAELAHGSPYHTHRIFKKAMGVTPAAYLQRTRIDAAKRMLERSEAPITDIARDVGFANASYFATQFRHVTGHTPSEYRRLRR